MLNPRQDLKVAFRRLQRTPGTSAVIVATLAIVLGANTLTFSFVNEILLNPLPAITSKEGLVNIHGFRDDKEGVLSFSYPAFQALAQADVFEQGLVGFNGRGLSLQSPSGPELVFGMLVSDNYFGTLGVRPRLGRDLSAADNRVGADGAVMLSDTLWRTHFGADPAILGTPIRLNGRSFTVVGIGPPRFSGHFVGFAADLWIPMVWAPATSGQTDLLEARETSWIEAFGRIKPGAGREAEATLSRVVGSLPEVDPSARQQKQRILIEPLTGIDRDLKRPVATFLALLQSATIIVALIALANVSSLLLARSMERRQETAVRLALGASRGSLLTPFALDAALLCGLGLVGGLILSVLAARVVPGWLPPFAIPLRFDIALDASTFAFSAAIGFVGILIAALGPGLAAARSQPVFALREGGSQRTTRSPWRSRLVVAQVAFATVILVSGSVFARFLAQAAQASPGFDIDSVQLTRLDASVLGLSSASARPLQLRALDTVRAIRGAEQAAFARVAPFSLGTLSLDAQDASAGEGATVTRADWNAVSPEFFATLGLGRLRGRVFSDFDNGTAPRVVVISEGLARRVFENGEAVGRSLRLGSRDDVATVVGVVADASMRRLGEAPRPQVYRPFDQASSPRISIVIRSTKPETLAPVIRNALNLAAPDLPVLESIPLRDFASFSQTGVRLGGQAGLALGALGLGLAAVGLFGLIAQTVVSRTREIAIRMAVGATSAQILSLILREGARLGVTGLGIGLVGSLGLSPLVEALVPNAAAQDPLAFLAAGGVVATAVILATLGPAFRASRVAPGVALRAN